MVGPEWGAEGERLLVSSKVADTAEASPSGSRPLGEKMGWRLGGELGSPVGRDHRGRAPGGGAELI